MNSKTYDIDSLDLKDLLGVQMNEKTSGLESLGLKNLGHIYRNLSVPQLIEHALARSEGVLTVKGAFCVKTGK